MGCNRCSSPEENMHGMCPECASDQRKRVRASIRYEFWKQNREEREDRGGQASIAEFVGGESGE